ncbi:phage tail tape measure protein [Clostridium tyrobutyricum]|uniref:phage tail tape measure protein n=1 Tax=Clostridium tyrobutyricum TaxID=1519 RepID=UPI0020CC0EDB|nr:phage tail tape measure protein [Clostridium tyrobutyricum]
MADEEISSLAVRLALDDSNFSKGMQNLKRNLGTIDSQFKSSVAGVKDWGKNLDNLKNNAQSLSDKVEVQRKIVQNYSSQLEKSKKNLEENSKKMMDLKNKVDATKTAYEESKATLGANDEQTKKLKSDLDDLNKKYQNNERTVLNNNKSVQGYTIQLNKAQGTLKGFEGQLDDTNKKIANFKLTSLSTSLKDQSEKLKSIGDGFNKVGNTALKFSAPIVAGLGAATKVATTFEHQIADIRKEVAASGASTEKVNSIMSQMSKDSLQWSGDFGQSTDDINEGLLTLVKDGYSADESIKIMNTSLYTSRGANEELATVVDQLGSSLEAYGMKTNNAAQTTQNMSHMADAFAYISNHTKASISSLGEAFSIAGSTAHAMGIPMTQTASAIGMLESNGIDASTAANALKAGLVNLTKPTKDMYAAMKEMNLQVFDSKGNMKDLPTLLNEIEKGTKGWTNEQKQSALAVIFGKESLATWNVLIHKGGDYLGELSNSANNANGEVKKLSDSMKDTSANNFKQLSASVHTLGVEFGQNVLPTVIPMVKEATNLVKAFGNLSPAMQKTIIDVAGFSLVAGGATKAVGGLLKTGGSVLGWIGKLTGKAAEVGVASEAASAAVGGVGTAAAEAGAATAGATAASGGLIAGLGSAALAAGPFILAGAGVVATGVAIHHVLTQQATPAVDLFADKTTKTSKTITDSFGNTATQVTSHTTKISEATKKAVGSYIQMDNNVKNALTNLYVHSTTLTNQTVGTMTSKYNQMGSTIKAGMDKHYNDEYKSLQQFFTKSKALSTTEEQNALKKLQSNNNSKKAVVDSYEKQIQTILKTAADKHRALTSDEQQKINSIQSKMKDTAVHTLSDNEVQAKVILQRIKDYGTRITAEQASSIIKNANKQRNGAVASANDQYNKTVAAIIKARDESHSITADQANKLIADAKKQRDGAVNHAENMRSQVVTKVTSMNSDTSKNVDTTTGNILTHWDKVKKWWENWHPVKKVFSFIEKALSSQNDKTNVTGLTGYASGTNNATSGWHIVGENGPELYYFAGGETVIDADSTDTILNQVNKSSKPSNGSDTREQLRATERYGEDLNSYFAKGMESSVSSISKPLDTIGANISTLMNGLIQKYLNYGQEGNKNLGAGITQSENSVIQPINTLNGNIDNLTSSFAQSFVKHGRDSISNLGDGITGNENIANSAVNKVTDDNKKILDDYSNDHTDYGTSSMDNLGTAITGNEGVVTNANNKVTTANKAILSNYVQLHTTYGSASMNNLTTGINNASPNVLAATNKISSDNKNVLNGLAASANPTGQNVSNGLSAGMKSAENNAVSIAKELTQKVLDAFTGKDGFDIHSPSKKTTGFGENVIQGFINGMSRQDVLNFFKNKIGGMVGFAKGASGQISTWLTTALAITGQPMAALPALEQIAMSESGGNPLSINLWDSNAAAGHPSKGLMQTIDSTFNQYAIQGLGDIWNPIANAVAAIRYMIARYGSILNVPGIKSMAGGGSYVGYASGTTNAVAGWRIVGENGPELEYSPTGGETILNNSDTMAMLSSSSTSNAGKALGSNLIAGISAGINESKDGLQYTLDTISNLFKYRIATAAKQTTSTVKNTVKETLNDVDSWLPDFSKALSNGINDNTVYTKNSALKLGTVLADSVMDERNARSQYLDAYNKKKMTADKALADLDGMNKKLQVSTNDDAKDMKNLLGVMTNESTEIVILTAEYNKLGKQYGYNSDKAVEALKKVQDLRAEYQKTGKDVQDLADKIKKNVIDNVNDISSNLKDALKQRYQDEQDAAEKQVNLATDTQTKILQSKLDALSDQESQMDIQYQDEDDEDKRAELERQLSMHYGAAKKKELQQELDDLNKTEERRHAKENLDKQKDDLQKQIDQLKENNDTMIKNIEEFYSNKLKDASLDAETQKMLVNNNQTEIVNLLKSYGKDYELAGSTLGDRLATGFKGSLTSISNMISNLKSQINNLSTNVDLSSISPLSTNVSNTITSNNIQQAYTIPQSIQSNQPIVIDNKIFLDGKQLAANQTQYVNNNLGTVNALNTRGL